MLRKILIAIDGSIHSKSAMTYVASIFNQSSEAQFTLFNVQPILSSYLLEEARTDAKADAELRRVINKQTADSNDMLEKAREYFIRMGIDQSRVQLVSQVRRQGQAKDIIDYAHQHLYDAIVVGRRGLSRLQKAFMGSTSAKLMAHAASIPVWIVDGDVKARRLLVPVDISSTTANIIDYLGLMLGGQSEVRMTLFHVDETPMGERGSDGMPAMAHAIAKGERGWQEHYWVEASKKLAAADIPGSQFEQIIVPQTGSIAKMILEQVKSGNYDTVVLGRRGCGNAFFFGSVSHYVVERLTDRALWLIG